MPPDPDESVNGSDASTTAAAIAGDGTRYVAWDDQGHQAWSPAPTPSSAVDLGPTVSTGIDPSLAATDQGAVALGWYDTLAANQMIGYLGNVTDIVVARPSPSLTVSQGPTGGRHVRPGQEGATRSGRRRYHLHGVVPCRGPRGSSRSTSTTRRQGSRTTSRCSTRRAASSSRATDVAAGPIKQTLDLDLKAGDYYFQCVVHPTTMFGTLAVVDGAK